MAELKCHTESRKVPEISQQAVLGESEPMPEGSIPVRGYDFSPGLDYHHLLQSFRTTGFQATNFGLAVDEIGKMVSNVRTMLTMAVLSCAVFTPG